jgi:hypothetical protein
MSTFRIKAKARLIRSYCRLLRWGCCCWRWRPRRCPLFERRLSILFAHCVANGVNCHPHRCSLLPLDPRSRMHMDLCGAGIDGLSSAPDDVSRRYQAKPRFQFRIELILRFRTYCRQPGHYTRFGVTSGWAVIRPLAGHIDRSGQLNERLDPFFTRKPPRKTNEHSDQNWSAWSSY